jgi:hypothetical protein
MIKEGLKVKIVKNTTSHNYNIGGTYVVNSIDKTKNPLHFTAKNPKTGAVGNWISEKDVVTLSETKENITENISILKRKLALEESKLEFLEKNNVGEFSLELYEFYKYLGVLEDKTLSKEDKAKELIQKIREVKTFDYIDNMEI